MEYSITGLRNSAATSRMMPMDSASRRFRCWDKAWADCMTGSLTRSASGGQWHGSQGPARDEEAVAESGLAVAERRTARSEHLAAGRSEDRVSGCGIPLHGWAETRVEVGLAGGDETELERGADGDPLVDRVVTQVSVSLRGRMRA